MPIPFHCQWRLELAAEIGAALRRYPGLRAVIVGGSVARGYADEFSDLELPLIWDELPADETRLRIAADLGATFLYPYNGPANEDNLLIHGFQVDFWQGTVAHDEQVIRHVLQEYSTDLGESNFMDTLRACVPLAGEELIRGWQEQARVYPRELALRNIRQQLDQIQASHLAVLASRDNPTLLYNEISSLQQRVFMLLLALNGQYFPTYKWLYPVLAGLALKPADCEQRFRRAYQAAPMAAAADTFHLVTETLQLVREAFPEIEITPALNHLKLSRTAHTAPIHLGSG
jgi:hypothetical protein